MAICLNIFICTYLQASSYTHTNAYRFPVPCSTQSQSLAELFRVSVHLSGAGEGRVRVEESFADIERMLIFSLSRTQAVRPQTKAGRGLRSGRKRQGPSTTVVRVGESFPREQAKEGFRRRLTYSTSVDRCCCHDFIVHDTCTRVQACVAQRDRSRQGINIEGSRGAARRISSGRMP